MPQVRFEAGAFDEESFLGDEVVDFYFDCSSGIGRYATYVTASQPGTVELLRLNAVSGEEADLGDGGAVAVVADTEDQQLVDFPVTGRMIIRYTNNNDTPGTVTCEVALG